jgi:hypothetical protein
MSFGCICRHDGGAVCRRNARQEAKNHVGQTEGWLGLWFGSTRRPRARAPPCRKLLQLPWREGSGAARRARGLPSQRGGSVADDDRGPHERGRHLRRPGGRDGACEWRGSGQVRRGARQRRCQLTSCSPPGTSRVVHRGAPAARERRPAAARHVASAGRAPTKGLRGVARVEVWATTGPPGRSGVGRTVVVTGPVVRAGQGVGVGRSRVNGSGG